MKWTYDALTEHQVLVCKQCQSDYVRKTKCSPKDIAICLGVWVATCCIYHFFYPGGLSGWSKQPDKHFIMFLLLPAVTLLLAGCLFEYLVNLIPSFRNELIAEGAAMWLALEVVKKDFKGRHVGLSGKVSYGSGDVVVFSPRHAKRLETTGL
jgi:hypothetical protein